MTISVHSASTRALIQLCEAEGVSPFLTAANCPAPSALGQRISHPEMVAMWDAAAERLDDGCLGVRTAAFAPVGAYSVIDYLFQASENVRSAVTMFARVLPHYNGAAALSISATRQGLALEMHCSGVPESHKSRSVQYTFAILMDRIRASIGRRPVPRAVMLTCSRPRDTTVLRHTFGSDIRFNSRCDLVVLDWATMLPHQFADARTARVLEEEVERMIARPGADDDLIATCSALVSSDPQHAPSLVAVARMMMISERSLQRRLRHAGLTLRDLVNDARRRRVLALIDEGAPVAEISAAGNLGSYRALARAFKRWTGVTISAYQSSQHAST